MKGKNLFLNYLFLGVIILFSARLFQLQILQGKKFQNLADENRIRKVNIVGPRGTIFDRHGEILAKNIALFKLGVGEEQKKITRDEALKLQTEGKDENLYIDFGREYSQGEVFSHAVGYLGEVTEDEINNQSGGREIKIKSGDWIGKMGIEQYYEKELRGKDGGELIEVDTLGKTIRRIGRVEPVSGKNLNLAIDADLQKIASRLMIGKKGAVVATNPQTGEVLVMYSAPSFDPNLFVTRRSEEAVGRLIADEEKQPLFNRVISGTYPPGSTFKIVTATAGLEEKKITRNTLINDPGVIYVGAFKYANWYFTGYGRTEGEINLVRAIKRSTDTFFYKLGETVGVEKLALWAGKFGLNRIYGIDLAGEISGLVPSPEWKEKVKGESWFLGNTYHLAIGQGDLTLTPLGVNLMTGVIANGGKICRPRMLKLNPGEKPKSCQDIGIKKETIEIIKEGMIGACSTGGTAWPFFEWNEKYPGNLVACKTGTAEYAAVDGKMETHAWFTAFTPAFAEASAGKPAIVVTVLVEGGGEGSSVAAPIAKEIIKEFFK